MQKHDRKRTSTSIYVCSTKQKGKCVVQWEISFEMYGSSAEEAAAAGA